MTITVTLTNNRHIAGANAAYMMTIPEDGDSPYQSVQEYVQNAIERVAESWADSAKVDQISVFEFVERIGAERFAAITAAAPNDPIIAEMLVTLRARQTVRLGSPDAINGIAYLVSVGLLTQQQADTALAY
jgi:hypothetical protein